MSANTNSNWLERNQSGLSSALEGVREALVAQARKLGADIPEVEVVPPAAFVPGGGRESEPASADALDTLCRLFGMSDFERRVLLLCAGLELDASFAPLCAAAQGDGQRSFATFGLAMAIFSEAHWSAMLPSAPLRYWRFIEVGSGQALATSALRIDERVLHFLTGLRYVDEQLMGFIEPLPMEDELSVPSHRLVAERVARVWQQRAERHPVVSLYGPDSAGKRVVAEAAARMAGLRLCRMAAEVLPTAPVDLDVLVRLWEREAALSGAALLVDCDELASDTPGPFNPLDSFLERTRGALIVTGRDPCKLRRRTSLPFEVCRPTPAEQQDLWERALGESVSRVNGQLQRLVSQFDLNAPAIRAACSKALDTAENAQAADAESLEERLWLAGREQARPRLDELAQHIDPLASWDDLVLPPRQLASLHEVAMHVRQRGQVYDHWGFRRKSARGLGISALFAGASGTGKTMAAEVLANELRLDLYRIDLSQVVSKYIGETEKNLRRVFDAAEENGAILLFDEADALFGKRTEVKDSHDRYANIEVSYLLQRMEVYRGLAILTTNLKDAIDDAFMRRIRFAVSFPFPNLEARTEIWRRVFPAETPTEPLDLGKLAQLNIPGGNIRNIALHAAFLAAEQGAQVDMRHLFRATQGEYAKLEKPLSDLEARGWL